VQNAGHDEVSDGLRRYGGLRERPIRVGNDVGYIGSVRGAQCDGDASPKRPVVMADQLHRANR